MTAVAVELNASPAGTGYLYFTAKFSLCQGAEFAILNLEGPERALWPGMYFWQASEPHVSY